MSVSRGCVVVETQPDQWYCLVAIDEYDYDFNGSVEVFGPATTANAAYDKMQRQCANPGGHNTYAHGSVPDHFLQLITEELKRQSQRPGPCSGWGR